MDTVVSAKELSKKFRLYKGNKDRLIEYLDPRGIMRHKEFWALKDVSFEIAKGECLGVIGRNGSGKSTLLQLIGGILRPTSGEIGVKGRVSALIELGAGFTPEFTGRENVIVQGAIMGFSHREMERKLPEIQAFADIGEFMELPVMTYSSGMYVRLAFAVAVSVEPDILLVDEVLAVGDFKFRQKCLDRVNELRKRASVVLVSHNLRDITLFCDRAMVLEHGKIVYAGAPDKAIERYMETVEAGEKDKTLSAEDEVGTRNEAIYGPVYYNREKISEVSHVWTDGKDGPVETMENGSMVSLDFSFRLLKPARNLAIGVPIWNREGNMITALSTDMSGLAVEPGPGGRVTGRLVMERMPLNAGVYASAFAVVEGKEFIYRDFNPDFRVKDMPVCFGCITPDHRWEFSGRGEKEVSA